MKLKDKLILIGVLIMFFPLILALFGVFGSFIFGCDQITAGMTSTSNCIGESLWGNLLNFGIFFFFSPFIGTAFIVTSLIIIKVNEKINS